MANEQNLIPQAHVLTVEESSRGGKASGEARRKKATMLSVLEKTLDETNNKGLTYRELVTLGLIKGAMNGSSKNYELITNMMEQKERKESEQQVFVTIPAKDIASSFIDLNRSIDDREYREYYLEGGRGSTKSSFVSEKIIEVAIYKTGYKVKSYELINSSIFSETGINNTCSDSSSCCDKK